MLYMASTKIANRAAFLSAWIILLSSALFAAPVSKLYPIILVPGDGGSQIEAKIDKPSTVHWWCSRKSADWFALWLNIELLAPKVFDCFVDNMRLDYNNVTRKTTNQPGVLTRFPQFGNTSTVEWLDSSQIGYTSYFYYIVEFLVKNHSYVRGVSIRGAPYDFRKAPNEMAEYLDDLRRLIIDTYETNDNQPVVLIGHSMGNLYVQYLLKYLDPQWKKKYIKSFISLAGPWGGAVKSLRLETSGDNLGVFVVNTLTARIEQRSMPSTAFLLPYSSFWKDDEVLIYAPDTNYTVNDYKRLFDDIDFPDGYQMRLDTQRLIENLESPGVDVHCIHGIGVKTPAGFKFSKSQWYDKQPDVIYGEGDGTVNLRSLAGCLRWVGQPYTQVFYRQFDQAEHLEILQNTDVMQYIATVLKT